MNSVVSEKRPESPGDFGTLSGVVDCSVANPEFRPDFSDIFEELKEQEFDVLPGVRPDNMLKTLKPRKVAALCFGQIEWVNHYL
jgi:hypothetical protein